MHRTLKAALIGIACLFGLPVAAFLTWDAIVFRPHLDDIHQQLVQANRDAQPVAPRVRRLIEASVDDVPAHVGSMLLDRFDPAKVTGNRQVAAVLWGFSVRLHFSAQQRDTLFATMAWNGRDHGLDPHARRVYGRPLSELNATEAATAVAWASAPGFYAHHPAELRLRARALLLRSEGNGPQAGHLVN